jgi:hypothetical protein
MLRPPPKLRNFGDADPDDDQSIDLTQTDNESESDWSEHTSDEEFIDDTDLGRAR